MDLRSLILTVTLLAAALSGCISAKEETPTAETDDEANDATADADRAEPPAEPPAPPVTQVYSYNWVGQRALDQRFAIEPGLDHLVADFQHTGQIVGQPILTDGDGEALDDTFSSITGGTFQLRRTMPATPGEGHLTIDAGPALDGYVAGVGSFSVTGYSGGEPDGLLHLGWTGQRNDPIVLDSEVRFYVPASVDAFTLDLTGTGQTTNGFRLLDPDGETVYTYGASSGPVRDGSEHKGKEGLWTVVLEGSTNGPWSLSARTTGSTST